MNDENQELLDLVDDQDTIVGTILRGEMVKANYRINGLFVRFVNGFVVNKHGLVWIQTRSPKKFIAPGGLDYSVAEHVLSGESYDDAIVRGFKEELGWQVDASRLLPLGTLPPSPDKPVFDKVYAVLEHDGADPALNLEEFTRAEWLSIADIKAHLAQSKTAEKASLAPALTLLEKYIQIKEG